MTEYLKIIIIIAADYHFQPISVQMLGPINKSASDLLTVLAHEISQRSGDEREIVFLFQHISVLFRNVNETQFRRVSKFFLEHKKNISRQREIEKANVHQISVGRSTTLPVI